MSVGIRFVILSEDKSEPSTQVFYLKFCAELIGRKSVEVHKVTPPPRGRSGWSGMLASALANRGLTTCKVLVSNHLWFSGIVLTVRQRRVKH
jgi:hypothetical protein